MEEVILGGGYTCSVCGQYQRTSALCHHDNNLIPETWDYVDSDTNKTNMKQTAIEWFVELTSQLGYVSTDILEQAKEMEKRQLCDMYIQGRKDNHLDYYPEKHANETYNEFFKKD